MSFRKELRVIPRAAWIIGWLGWAGLAAALWFVAIPNDRDMSHWPLAGQFSLIFLMPIFVLVIVAFFGYVYGDAKRRGMRYVVWTLLAMFVPYGIGIILYFLLRDPLPAECAGCHTLVLAKFTFCPRCGATMRPVCPQCGKTIETGWTNCGYCGTKVPARA